MSNEFTSPRIQVKLYSTDRRKLRHVEVEIKGDDPEAVKLFESLLHGGPSLLWHSIDSSSRSPDQKLNPHPRRVVSWGGASSSSPASPLPSP